MNSVPELLSAFGAVPVDHLNALVSLGAIGLAGLTIYVAFAIATRVKKP